MADYTRIRSTVDAYIATLTLDRPDHGNAVDDAMHSELTTVFSDVGRDPGVRVVVLTGAGTTFCRGGDSSPARTFTTLTGLTPIEEARLIVETLLDLDKPVIAAVNGDALGLGAILASLADVAFVAPSARIGDRHVLGGVTAGNGSAALWPVLVGLNRARYLVLNGELLTSEQAVAAGLLHEVAQDPLAAAHELAARWAELPPFALQSTKSVLNRHLKAAAGNALGYGLALEEQSLAEFTARRAQ
jgi:enoyl-CoA hydratase/carnithine racemase